MGSKKNPQKIKTNKKTKKHCECKLALPIEVRKHMTDQGCKEKNSFFESKLQEATSDGLTLGARNHNQAIHCLKVWCNVVKWVNNRLGSSNWVDLNGFKDKKEMNELSKTTKTHLCEISKQKGVNAGIRNILHAKDVLVKGKSDKMFQECCRAIAAEQPKFKMILGITNMGKRQRWKKGAKTQRWSRVLSKMNGGMH